MGQITPTEIASVCVCGSGNCFCACPDAENHCDSSVCRAGDFPSQRPGFEGQKDSSLAEGWTTKRPLLSCSLPNWETPNGKCSDLSLFLHRGFHTVQYLLSDRACFKSLQIFLGSSSANICSANLSTKLASFWIKHWMKCRLRSVFKTNVKSIKNFQEKC